MNAQTPTTDLKTSEAAAVVAPVAAPEAPKPRRRLALMLALPALLLVGAGGWWLTGGRYETTANAYFHQSVASISSDLGGRVTEVAISDGQPVKEGDLLFRVDPEPYRLALDRAEAAVASARLQVEQLKVAYAQAVAQQALAADEADYQQGELERQSVLSEKGVAATNALDDAQYVARRAAEQLAVARQTTASALAALGGDAEIAVDDHPAVLAALAARDAASYDLARTEVHAPVDGIVYQASSFKAGQVVGAGTTLFSLVETADSWIDANFKETQLAGIEPGQTAEVTFDTRPGQSYEAVVESLGAGTGSEFSLLPAQNATGNWVKVTQRVPVRLRLAEGSDVQGLASGLSAEVSVDTGRSRSLPGFASFAATPE